MLPFEKIFGPSRLQLELDVVAHCSQPSLGISYCSLAPQTQLEIYGGEYQIDGLETGASFFVRVFAKNQMVGWGEPSRTSPVMMTPRRAPEVGIATFSAVPPCILEEAADNRS